MYLLSWADSNLNRFLHDDLKHASFEKFWNKLSRVVAELICAILSHIRFAMLSLFKISIQKLGIVFVVHL